MDLTGLAAKDVVDDDQEREETSSTLAQTKVTESCSSQWTDEKHSLYLNSIESTFVEELYRSMDSFDRNRCSSVSKSSKNKQTGQFKVLREGHWSKLNFERDVSENKQCDNPQIDLLDSPWIRHYNYSSERNSVRKFTFSRGTTAVKSSATTTRNFEPLQEDSASEVMDQNFVDDEAEDEKAERIHHEIKRCRTAAAFVSGKDQVVPAGNVIQEDDDITEDRLQHQED